MRKTLLILTAIVTMATLLQTVVAAQELIPEGMVINEIYRRGVGAPVGKVVLTQGEVVIIHKGDDVGYVAKKDRDLFQMDTVICRDRGRALLEMSDGSRLTLASRTSLKLNRSVYKEKEKDRSSFFAMARGKARFWITKLVNFKRSEVRIMTPTAVVGVRGSDVIVEATPEISNVTTGPDTEGEFYPTVGDREIQPFSSFNAITVTDDGTTTVDDISPDDFVEASMDVPFETDAFEALDVDTGAGAATGGTQTGTAKKKVGTAKKAGTGAQTGTQKGTQTGTTKSTETGTKKETQTGTEKGTQGGTGTKPKGGTPSGGTGPTGQVAGAISQATTGDTAPLEEEVGTLIEQQDLIPPEVIPDPPTDQVPETPVVDTTVGDAQQQDQISDIQDTVTNTITEIREDVVTDSLPDFPSTPQD